MPARKKKKPERKLEKKPLTRAQLRRKYPEEMAKQFLLTSSEEERELLLNFRHLGEPPEMSPQQKMREDMDKRRLSEEAKRYKGLYNDLVREQAEAMERYEIFGAIPMPKTLPTYKAKHSSSIDEAVAVFVTSDWHLEERVDSATISGLNEYTPEIGVERLRKMWCSAMRMIEKERQASKIDTLYLAVLGDLITGFIHEELVESNYLHPVEAVELAEKELLAGIKFLAEDGKFKEIKVVCCFGNHGRTTHKRRVSTAAKNNYEWAMYRRLARMWSQMGGDKRVEWFITDGYQQTHSILGYNVRFHHGDNIRYAGGVGGLTIPLNKAIQAWNKNNPYPADFDVLGHYHSLHFLPDALVNGSVIGYNAYAQSIKARFEEPQQALFLIAKEHGPTCFNRIWVT